ncbi:ABC transporter ATP-binding protein [Alteromonadaceae bacterium M269]|nr:ABC transporter ATP-binding protein [Alteromonadaceae bacterium M269]
MSDNLNQQPLITLKNIRKMYYTDQIETLALKDINLEINKGEFISIMGPSGCGKSTLLNMLGLLDRPSTGTIEFEGKTLDKLSDKALAPIRNEKLGFVFQTFHLIPDLRVVDNVALPLLYRPMSNKERRERALNALKIVGLDARVNHFPTQLSGGQQQRVAIARAIVGEPPVILADEPTGNLDSHMGNEIMSILFDLNENRGTTIVMVTHDREQADQTQRTVRVFDGQLVH